MTLAGDETLQLATGDSVALPGGASWAFTGTTPDLEWLEVRLPAS